MINQTLEIAGDLAVEITKCITPRESQTDAGGYPERTALKPSPLQFSGIKSHTQASA